MYKSTRQELDPEEETSEQVTVNGGTIIYVTIGVPFSCIPIMQKVMIYVDPKTKTPTDAAKALRKQVADNIENHGWVKGTNFTPAELYFEIYGSVGNTIPFHCSANAPSVRRPA